MEFQRYKALAVMLFWRVFRKWMSNTCHCRRRWRSIYCIFIRTKTFTISHCVQNIVSADPSHYFLICIELMYRSMRFCNIFSLHFPSNEISAEQFFLTFLYDGRLFFFIQLIVVIMCLIIIRLYAGRVIELNWARNLKYTDWFFMHRWFCSDWRIGHWMLTFFCFLNWLEWILLIEASTYSFQYVCHDTDKKTRRCQLNISLEKLIDHHRF